MMISNGSQRLNKIIVKKIKLIVLVISFVIISATVVFSLYIAVYIVCHFERPQLRV